MAEDEDFAPATAEAVMRASLEASMKPFERDRLEKDAQRNWDIFYKRNTTHFFKDRHWIHREFLELAATGEVCTADVHCKY